MTLADGPDRLADHLALMKELWTNDEGSHAGPFVSVEPSWSWPKPAKRGGPPIHLGARASRRGFRDIAIWGDGWLPIEGYGTILDHLDELYGPVFVPAMHLTFTPILKRIAKGWQRAAAADRSTVEQA